MGLRSRERPWSLPPASSHKFQSLYFLFHDPWLLFSFSFFKKKKKIFYFSSTQKVGHEALPQPVTQKSNPESLAPLGSWTYHQGVHAKSLSRVRLCDPMDCSLPGSSDHGILQARILEWVAMPSSWGSSQPRDGTRVSFVSCATWEAMQ